MSDLINIKPASQNNAFDWRGASSIFLSDRVFNGYNTGLGESGRAKSAGLGTVPSRATINTVKTRPADKTRRIQKGTI